MQSAGHERGETLSRTDFLGDDLVPRESGSAGSVIGFGWRILRELASVSDGLGVDLIGEDLE